MAAKGKRGRRPSRAALLRRWLAVGALGLVGLLYYQPLTSFLEARGRVAREQAELRSLERENVRLERALAAQTSEQALVREARRLAYVKPGERLFIVKGIPEWRRAHERRASTIEGDG